jgi:hypothetical protein
MSMTAQHWLAIAFGAAVGVLDFAVDRWLKKESRKSPLDHYADLKDRERARRDER